MFTLNEIIQAITGKETHFPDLLFTEAVVDSRQAVPGTLFIAAPGERTDGHKFVSSAFAAGARAALIQEDVDGDYDSIDLRSSDDIDSRELLTGEKPVCIRVDNSIAALQKMQRIIVQSCQHEGNRNHRYCWKNQHQRADL